jgi:GMP synthase-like glutamine amidotransferase
MHMSRRRIGILVTNTDESAFAQRHPKDGEKFTRLLNSVRPGWEVAVYTVKDGVFPVDIGECDGYVITGSPASVNGSDAWIARLLDLIRELDRARKPAVGCCFGHQAIALALGGKVERNLKGWGFGVAPTHFGRRESWMQPPARTLRLFAAHNEQVTELPAGAVVLGGNDHCPVGSFRVGGHFFTTEYHPEMTPEFLTALAHEIEGYVGSDLAARARAEARQPTDGAVFAEWMARFLEMER